MGSKEALELKIPGPAELGPKMAALSDDRQRRFVWAMLHAATPSEAARIAGYAANKGSERVRGCLLMQRADVLEALHEVGWKKLYGAAIKSIASLERVVDDPDHPKHLVAVAMVLDRTGYAAQTEHKVTVEHRVTDLQVKALAARFADEFGVPREKLLGTNVVEGDFTEVSVANEQTADG